MPKNYPLKKNFPLRGYLAGGGGAPPDPPHELRSRGWRGWRARLYGKSNTRGENPKIAHFQGMRVRALRPELCSGQFTR